MVLAVQFLEKHNGRPKWHTTEHSIIIPMRFEDFDIWLTWVFWTIQEFDQYIAYGTDSNCMQQIHIRGGPNEGCEAAENPF